MTLTKHALTDFTFGKLVEAKSSSQGTIQGRIIGFHQQDDETRIRVAFLGSSKQTINMHPIKLRLVAQDRLAEYQPNCVIGATFLGKGEILGHIIYIVVDDGVEKIRVKFADGKTRDVTPNSLTLY